MSHGRPGDGPLREAIPGAVLELVALASDTTPEHPEALHPLHGPRDKHNFRPTRAVLGRQHPSVRSARRATDLGVAVGGRHLRSDGLGNPLKTQLALCTQLPGRDKRTPIVHLLQSIGPFPSDTPGRARPRRPHAIQMSDDRSAVGVNA